MKMAKLTKKYIFEQKLKGEPIDIWRDDLDKVYQFLIDQKIWSTPFYQGRRITCTYPTQMLYYSDNKKIKKYLMIPGAAYYV